MNEDKVTLPGKQPGPARVRAEGKGTQTGEWRRETTDTGLVPRSATALGL